MPELATASGVCGGGLDGRRRFRIGARPYGLGYAHTSVFVAWRANRFGSEVAQARHHLGDRRPPGSGVVAEARHRLRRPSGHSDPMGSGDMGCDDP